MGATGGGCHLVVAQYGWVYSGAGSILWGRRTRTMAVHAAGVRWQFQHNPGYQLDTAYRHATLSGLPVGLCGVSAAAVGVLGNYFGANSSFAVETDSTSAGLVGVKRPFANFASALDELVGARIW